MKKHICYIIICLAIFISKQNLNAQTKDVSITILTADSLPTGNNKDILTGFYNLYLNDLTGVNKEVKFSSNLFAIMLRYNKNLIIDTNYIKNSWAKRFNIDFDASFENSNKLKGFSMGLKYAIIDKRDVTISKKLIPLALGKLKLILDFHRSVISKISIIKDSALKKNYNDQAKKFFSSHDSLIFENLYPELQKIILECSKTKDGFDFSSVKNYSNLSIGMLADKSYKELLKSFQNMPLLVSYLNLTTFTNKFQMSNIDLGLDFSKGIINPNASNNLELNIKGSLGFANDTTKVNKDLSRSIANGEIGLNWVIKGSDNRSNIEFKLSASENYIISGLYNSENKQLFTMNGTLRFRISNDFWFPLEFKYDPKTGNVFGLINISSNFNWLRF